MKKQLAPLARAILPATCGMILLLGLNSIATADERCGPCDREVRLAGEYYHYVTPSEPPIKNAGALGEAAYREEIYGMGFDVVVPNLAAGDYTVVIGVTEGYYDEPGKRAFDINAGPLLIATNLDVFALVGKNSAHHLTARINHPGDADAGPLTITFRGRKDNAKFNTIEIKDAAGKPVVSAKAADFVDEAVAPIVRPPPITYPVPQSTPHVAGKVVDAVDPFFGTCGGGNTIPGPSLPFGMIKPGPDTGKNDQNSGWSPDGAINGFSQTHVSGTGGGCKYGNILVQPTAGNPSPTNYGSPRANERAAIGYYAVTLSRYGIDAEITTTERGALYRFTYSNAAPANILFDVSHALTGGAQWGEAQSVVGSAATILSSNEVSGFTRVTGGWNLQTNPYTVFFYAVTDTAAQESGTWHKETIQPGGAEQAGKGNEPTGAWLGFGSKPGQTVQMKIGISYVSVANAKANVSKLAGFDFDGVRANAAKIWDDALGKIQISGATPEQRKLFYTSLYHTMLMPVDRSGDNPLWQSAEPYYDDHYAIWDTFRSSSPLLMLIAPARQADIVRSLVDIYRHEGWLPDARSGNYNGRTQGGSDVDILLADAFVKKLPGIDWPTAYAGMVKNAEVSPADPFKEGRGGLADWHQLGHLTIEGTDRSGNKQMEYAANDFALATVARGLGKTDDETKYFKRSRNWENLWNTNFTDAGFSGFIQPRHRDGSWKTPFSATEGCSWGGDTFYEGNSWVYSLFVPHDMTRLIEKCGGNERFVERLDAFFNGRFDISNEPGFLTPYLYAWAGRHDRTCDLVRQIVTTRFQPSRSGLPGNDDSGAMSAWYVFSALGIFPVAGQDLYVIGSPLFPSATLDVGNGKHFNLAATNTSPENKYVVAARLNGRPLAGPWLRHSDIVAGGVLELDMAATPAKWKK